MKSNSIRERNLIFVNLKKTVIHMKICFFIMLASLQFVFANSLAQHITLNLRNARLEDVFKSIADQSQYKFLYNDDVLAKAPRISMTVTNKPLEEVLNRVVARNGLAYKIMANTILVSVPSFEVSKNEEQSKVSGTVVDDKGTPLSNASVIVIGTSSATMTDKDGKFQIQANVGNTLEVRHIGFKTARVNISSLTNMRISLIPEEAIIEEVQVVANGYQTIDRKLFTGDTTNIKAQDAERAGIQDISRMLEGQAAGVSVQNVSGTFGAAPKIRVRGATSITGDNKPLWVIDGVILEDVVNISNDQLSTGDANTLLGSSVAGINPDDIESFEILKDAAATSLYGARAMNGVIIITTKKGRAGTQAVSYLGNYTTYLRPSYSQFDIVNSYDQMSIYSEIARKGAIDYALIRNNMNSGIFGNLSRGLSTWKEDGTPLIENTPEGREAFLKRY